MNPPYSRLDDTMEKVIQDGAEAIMVLPDWRSTSWWEDIQPYVLRRYWYPPGKKIFELEGSSFDEGTRWGVWAYYVNVEAAQQKQDEDWLEPDKVYTAEVLEGTHQKTRSSRRRQQRKAAARYWDQSQ